MVLLFRSRAGSFYNAFPLFSLGLCFIPICTVICKDGSRIGRDYLQTGFYTEVFFRQHGVRFIAVSNGVDSKNGESKEFAPFLNIMAEWYVRNASRKLKAVYQSKGNNGKRTTNGMICGYLKVPDDKTKWGIDPEAAAVVLRLFQASASGMGPFQTDHPPRGFS